MFVVRAKVLYGNLILKEVKQVFTDGSIRERNNLHLSEKMCYGEDKKDTLKRMFAKKLGIESKLNYETHSGGSTKDVKSPSYPSLDTRYTLFDSVVFLTEEQYKEDGYVEKEKSTDSTTYFEWVPIR